MAKQRSWILGTLLLAGMSGAPAAAQTVFLTVDDSESLLSAIEAANAAPTTVHQISFESDITLDRSLVPIAAEIDFVGDGHRISGADAFPIFFVDSGEVYIEGLTLANGNAQGGNGGSRRSGGGLGAGGALFVNQTGSVNLIDVIFENNDARGGRGGDDGAGNPGGGGGGFHGDGGDFGGGGGWYGNGAPDGGGGGGLFGNGESSEGVDLGGGNGGGKESDGGGGAGNTQINGTGGNGNEFEGGGFGATGGTGGRFGGGGGSSTRNAGTGGDFGGGGGSAGGPNATPGGNGGDGGFGGGGGASSNSTASSGGFGAGDGVISGFGGAGSSLGGAVFVRTGGSLTYTVTGSGQLTTGNSVTAAEAGSGNPELAGSDLYVMEGVAASLDTAAAVEAELTGSIGGAGSLIKSGAGTLTLSGTNSYTGGTVIEDSGSVLAGDTGSLQGAIRIETGALLRFDQEDSGTYAGAIDGAGDIEKQGSGTVTFSGNNSYDGNTTVSQGTLVFTSSSLPDTAAEIASGATLRFDLGQNASFAGSFTGPEESNFEKSGSGSLTLSASSAAFAGTSNVTAGELSLASGISLGGTIEIASGARLAGSGTAAGKVTVLGTLAPGDTGTIGSLSLDELELQSGGELEIELTDSASDSVDVTGDATLAANSTLTLLPSAGDYTTPVSYDILTAGGSLTSNITIGSQFCLLTSELEPMGNSLRLTLSPSPGGLLECADTSNQRAVAIALADLLETPAYIEVEDELFTVPQDELPEALDLMSGEGLAGFQSTRLAAATQFLGTLAQRIRDPSAKDTGPAYPLALGSRGPLMPSLGAAAPRLNGSLASSVRAASTATSPITPFSFVSLRGESGLGGFLDGFATFAGIEGNGNTHDTDFNLYGTNAGVDWAFADGALVGAAFGYTRSRLSVTDLATWGSGNTVQGALYGGYATDLFYVNAVARYGHTRMKTTRRISFGADLYESARAEFDGTSLSGYAEVGMAAVELAETYFQPTAAFQYTYVQTDDFVENGAASLNLGVLTPSVHSMISNVGLRVFRPFSMDREADIIPELRVRYVREFGDIQRPVAARFSPTTAPAPFTTEAAEIGRDLAIIGVGWTVVGEGNSSLSLQYDATVNQDILAHTVGVGLLIVW